MSSTNDPTKPLPPTETLLSLELLASQIAGLREREEKRMLETKPLNETLQAIHAVLFELKDGQQRLEDNFKRLEERVDRIETRLDSIETRLDSIETRLDSIETRLDSIETRVNAIETRVNAIETRLDSMDERLGHIEIDIRDIRSEHNNIRRGITASQTMVLDELRELDKRVSRLEQAISSPTN